ncbi:hypothetical protein HY494_00930 [Candidatus Woesearchaeota archaeon]|nr:hypothetical protein [Candidatus Woesearchaeota archaeon]
MIEYSDKKWINLTGGYKIKYNPISILKKLEDGFDIKNSWEKLWQELHHQGDIGDASYASLVKLVEIQEKNANFDWNFYALVATIELERLRKTNPKIPNWLKTDYKRAISKIYQIAVRDLLKTDDPKMINSILSVLAIFKKQYVIAAMIAYSEDSEIKEYLNNKFAWDKLYNTKKEI